MPKRNGKFRFNDLTNPFQRARSMAGISQTQLGAALGVGQAAISDYESGVHFPESLFAKRFVLWCRKRNIRMSMDEVYDGLKV